MVCETETGMPARTIAKIAIAAARATVNAPPKACLLYTSDAADDLLCVELGGRRIIQKKQTLYDFTERTWCVTCLTIQE